MNKTTMVTRLGNEFDILDPQPDAININDIAWALAHQCRFNGHVPQFYSVADHSIRVSLMVPEKYQLTALLHDAAEAYTGDIISPLKKALGSQFRTIEKNIEQFIAVKFGLIYPFSFEVKDADRRMFELEEKWRAGQFQLDCKTAHDSYLFFMNRFEKLMEKREKLNGVITGGANLIRPSQ